MTDRSIYGNGLITSGAYTAAFGTEINTMATGNSVLSSIAFDNTPADSFGDLFAQISAILPLTSSETLVAGACLTFWIAYLQADGLTYGDGRVSASAGGSAYTPGWPAVGGCQFAAGSSISTVAGDTGLFTFAPQKFKLVVQNNIGFALGTVSGAQQIYLATSLLNLNG